MLKRFVAAALAVIMSVAPAFALSDSSIPTKTPTPWANTASSPTFVRTPPVGSQIGIQNCAASFTDGFPPLTFTPASAGGCPPFGADMNGILQLITQWLRWQAAGNAIQFDAAFSSSIGGYPKGAVLAAAATAGCTWTSTVDNNASNPDSGGANWLSSCPSNSIGATSTGSANAQIVTAPPFLLQVGSTITFLAGFSNTAALQVNVNGAGLKNFNVLTSSGQTASTGGEIVAGQAVEMFWDGTEWQCLSCGIFLAGTAGQVVINQGAHTNALKTISGDLSITSAGVATVLGEGGIPFAYAGGRLIAATSCSGALPVQTNNISAATVLCYVPFGPGFGNLITVNGVNHSFTTQTLTLNSGLQSAGNAYDVYEVATGICIDGLAWAGRTARNDAIQQLANGLQVNSGIIAHCYNNAVDLGPVSAQAGTHLGAVYASANGQTQWSLTPAGVSGGTGNILGVCNDYNRVPVLAHEWDTQYTPTPASFTFTGTASGHQFDYFNRSGSALNNTITWIDCLGAAGAGSMQVKIQSNVTFAPVANATNQVSGGASLACVDFDTNFTNNTTQDCGPAPSYGGQNATPGCAATGNQGAFAAWPGTASAVDSGLTLQQTTFCSTFGVHTVWLLVSFPGTGGTAGGPVTLFTRSASGMILEGLF